MSLEEDLRLQSDNPAEGMEGEASAKDMEDALRAITTSWLGKIKKSQEHKQIFTDDAHEARNFFDGQGDWFWADSDKLAVSPIAKNVTPAFKVVVNKVFEAVKLFASVIYHRNPVRTVTPRKFPVVSPLTLGIDPSAPPPVDPMTGMPQIDPNTGMPVEDPMQKFIAASNAIAAEEDSRKTVASLMEAYLNYTPVELNLKEQSRKCVDEAIVTGLGLWWTESIDLEGDEGEPYSVIGSFFDSSDNIQWDPDADEQEDILWCARRCVHPIGYLKKKYQLDDEALKGHIESYESEVAIGGRGYRNKKKNGQTNDLVVYWKIWSKTGFGHTLKGSPKEFRDRFDSLGDNCYIVVAEGVDFPLNAPKAVALEQIDPETGMPETLFGRTRWPIPFYTENNGWPFVALQFHRKTGYSWPISHIKPGIPELKCINWIISFLISRIMVSCKTVIAVNKAAEQDFKDQILKHEQGGFTLVELSETMGRNINEIVSVLTMPSVNRDIWEILTALMELFDKRVGLTELVYGMTRNQFRSAAEAQVKSEQISVRPDDMANVLEDAMSMLARREALAARWLLEGKDVAPIIGPLGAEAWDKRIIPIGINAIAREFQYRIEAGSARKPNKAGKVEQMQMAMQTIGPIAQQLASTGMVTVWNALISDWAKSLDIDPTPYLLPEPPPPPPPLPPGDPGLPPSGPSGPPPPGDGGGGGPPSPQIPPELNP